MTEPNDDLGGRLERLAPPVDVEAALAGVQVAGRRRQTRQRQLVAATMAVVMLVLISGVALARQDRGLTDVATSDPAPDDRDGEGDGAVIVEDRRPGTTAGPGTTVPESVAPTETTVTTSSTPSPTRPTPSTTRVEQDPPDGPGNDIPEVPLPLDDGSSEVPPPPPGSDVAFTIRPEQPSVRAGERLTFWVDITNRGSAPIKVNAGECGSVEVLGPNGANLAPLVAGWSGANGSLPGYAATHDLAVHAYPTEPSWGGMQRLCSPTNYQPTLGYTITLQPGATTSHVYVWDAGFLPPVAGAVPSVEIRARVRFPDSDRQPEHGSLAVPVVDDAGAHASPGPFLAAVDADPVVRTWLTQHPAPASGYRVTLAFVRGSFELWIDTGTQRLRVRGAPATGTILEIRSLPSDSLPSDDPAAWGSPPGEVVLFPT